MTIPVIKLSSVFPEANIRGHVNHDLDVFLEVSRDLSRLEYLSAVFVVEDFVEVRYDYSRKRQVNVPTRRHLEDHADSMESGFPCLDRESRPNMLTGCWLRRQQDLAAGLRDLLCQLPL